MQVYLGRTKHLWSFPYETDKLKKTCHDAYQIDIDSPVGDIYSKPPDFRVDPLHIATESLSGTRSYYAQICHNAQPVPEENSAKRWTLSVASYDSPNPSFTMLRYLHKASNPTSEIRFKESMLHGQGPNTLIEEASDSISSKSNTIQL